MTDITSEKELFNINNDKLLNNEKLLASEIKNLEAISDQQLDSSYPFIVRIDGVSFRNYTRGFNKPFDQRMTRAFIRTSADLLQRFNPLTIFYQSDEISLVFDGYLTINAIEKNPREHMYSGRIQKLVSVLASYTAAKFNKYINEEDWSDIENEHVRERLISHSAYFDGRAFSVPNQFAAMASIYWRKNTYELRELLRTEKNWDMLNEAPKNIIYGTFLKKELYDLECIDRKTQQSIIAKRSRIRIGSFEMNKLLPTNEEKIKFIMSKYWNDSNTIIDNIEIPNWWMKYYQKQDILTTD
ncbi:unnamed protein product [Rotaria sp. Silwood1]|nr:unnamed protein product [Rotaria sp. Silwood1]CAF4841153.1 unnamed protein product [Rotaria sp. Silwood1]